MFTTNPIQLSDLLDDVHSGKIQLPDFQRGWVWDDERIKDLLVSISRSFPVGAVMTLSGRSSVSEATDRGRSAQWQLKATRALSAICSTGNNA